MSESAWSGQVRAVDSALRCPLCGDRRTSKHDLGIHIADGHSPADLTPAQAARLEAIEAAPWAEEALMRRMANAVHSAACSCSDEEVSWSTYWQQIAVAAIDVMRGAADDGAVGRVHCSTCECIHEPCGYVIGSAGCEDFHDRAAVGAPATVDGDDRG